MAETAQTEMVEVLTEYPTRMQCAMLAPVKRIAELIPAGDKEARIIGYISGVARGVSFRKNVNSADGEPARGLIGAFEGIPQYDDMPGMQDAEKCARRPRLASRVCFLPEAAMAPVCQAVLTSWNGQVPGNDTLKRGQRSDVLGHEVPVAVEIAIRKSDSPVGYEWVVRGVRKVEKISPIALMRRSLGIANDADIPKLVAQGEGDSASSSPKAAAKDKAKAKKRGR